MSNRLSWNGWTERDMTALQKVVWAVTEKVHGANFSFIFDTATQSLRYAKRKDFLSWEDDFFGFQTVVKKVEHQVVSLFESMRLYFPEGKYILYGELIGGSYPHPDITPYEEFHAVQTGIYYAPDIHFCAFDLAIIDEFEDKIYLDYQVAASYFMEAGLLFAPPLYIGSLESALDFDIQIPSSIPSALELPTLPDNIIEGIVIKPYAFFHEASFPKRPILKIKNPAFDETPKFHEAEKWSFQMTDTPMHQDLDFLLGEIRLLVNSNRLESAVSKIGFPDNPTRTTEIEEEMLRDIKADFNQLTGHLLNELDNHQNRWMDARILSDIRLLIQNSY